MFFLILRSIILCKIPLKYKLSKDIFLTAVTAHLGELKVQGYDMGSYPSLRPIVKFLHSRYHAFELESNDRPF